MSEVEYRSIISLVAKWERRVSSPGLPSLPSESFQAPLLTELEALLRKPNARAELTNSLKGDGSPLPAQLSKLSKHLVAHISSLVEKPSMDFTQAGLCLRILRNLCAQNLADTQAFLRESSSFTALSAALQAVMNSKPELSMPLLTLLRNWCQFVSNFLTQNFANQEVVWKSLFHLSDSPILYLVRLCENHLNSVALELNQELRTTTRKLVGDIAMASFNLVSGSPNYKYQWIDHPIFEVIGSMLRHISKVSSLQAHTSDPTDSFYWPYLLIKSFFICLPEMLPSFEAGKFGLKVERELSTLLNLVDATIEAKGLLFVDDLHLSSPDSSGAVVLNERGAIKLIGLLERLSEPVKEELASIKLHSRTYGSASRSLLNAAFYTLQILHSIGLIAMDAQKELLVEHRLVEAIIKLLEYSYVHGTPYANSKNPITAEMADKSSLPFDFGFRVAILSVIANFAYRSPPVQDRVRELNGIPLVLNGCKTDDLNPWIREWSLFAVRNLCEFNEANQKYISALKAQGLAPDANEELQNYNMRATLDEETGRVRLLPRPTPDKDN